MVTKLAGRDRMARPPTTWTLVVIALAQLMVMIDVTVVNVALPSMQRSLSLSSVALGWVITAYTLTFGSILLLSSRVGDIYGRRRVFMTGVGLFTVASLLGGLSPNATVLLVARTFQGAGAAIGAATALSLITAIYPEGPARNRAVGVYAAMEGAGATVGLLVGGLLVSAFSWRWVLLINVPVGAFVVLMAPLVIPRQSGRAGRRIDVAGAALATAGLGALVYGLSRAGSAGWSDATTLVPLVIAAILLPAFVAWEAHAETPLVPSWAVLDRTRGGAYLIAFLMGGALIGMFFFLTQFFQNVLGYGALKSGLAFLPVSVGILAAAGLATIAVGRIGPRNMVMAGTLVTASGLFWLSLLGPTSTYLTGVLPPMLLLAVGLGLTFVPNTSSAISGLSDDDSGLGSGLFNTALQIGPSVAIAALTTLSVRVTNDHLSHAANTLGRSPIAPDVLRAALTAGFSAGLRVSALLVVVAFVSAAVILPRRAVDARASATDVAAA